MTTKQHGQYGRLMLDLVGTSLTEVEHNQLQNPHVGGVILFARNVESREQISALVGQIRAASDSGANRCRSRGRQGTAFPRWFYPLSAHAGTR